MDRQVRRAVLDRLAAVEEMATRASARVSAPLVRRHIQTITDGWRELLVQHQPDLTGRCPVCSHWLRRRRWPCEIWVTAHRHLIGDGTEPIERTTRNSNPFCQPRQVVVIPRQLDAAAAERAAERAAARTASPPSKSRQGIDPSSLIRQPPTGVGRWRRR